MIPDEERDRIRQQVIDGRRRQGLPDHIEDPAFLARIAAILLADLDAEGRSA